ncbi:hypothetical protein RhiirA4_404070, partial [Rhizophagus irregularis]
MIKPINNVNESNKVYSSLSVISDSYDYKIGIFSVPSDYKNLKVDNEKVDEIPIGSIGHNLTKENFVKENIEKALKELCGDFDVCIIKIDATNFTTTIKDKIRPEEDEQNLKADQDDLNKYFGQIVGVDDKDKEEMISKINKISIMKSTMEKLLDKVDNQKKYQSKIDEIFQAHEIIFSDYKKTDKKPRKDGIVTKW